MISFSFLSSSSLIFFSIPLNLLLSSAPEEISPWAGAGEKGSREGAGTAGDWAHGSQPSPRRCCCLWAPAPSLTQQLSAVAPVHGSPSAGHTDRAGPCCGREGSQNYFLQVIDRIVDFCYLWVTTSPSLNLVPKGSGKTTKNLQTNRPNFSQVCKKTTTKMLWS